MKNFKQKLLISLIIFLAINQSVNAQHIAYRDIKKQYSVKDYKTFKKNGGAIKFSPVLAGVLSGAIPGVGQFYTGEIGRGFLFAGGFALGSLVSSTGLVIILVGAGTGRGVALGAGLFYGGAFTAVSLWGISVYDAVKISKLKNMAYADKNKTALNIRLLPCLIPSYTKNTNTTAGLSLQITF